MFYCLFLKYLKATKSERLDSEEIHQNRWYDYMQQGRSVDLCFHYLKKLPQTGQPRVAFRVALLNRPLRGPTAGTAGSGGSWAAARAMAAAISAAVLAARLHVFF